MHHYRLLEEVVRATLETTADPGCRGDYTHRDRMVKKDDGLGGSRRWGSSWDGLTRSHSRSFISRSRLTFGTTALPFADRMEGGRGHASRSFVTGSNADGQLPDLPPASTVRPTPSHPES